MRKKNDLDWLKVKKGDKLPGFVFDNISYPSDGVVINVESATTFYEGLEIEVDVQFPKVKYRIYIWSGEKISRIVEIK